MLGFIALITARYQTNCPTSGCVYNPPLLFLYGFLLPSGLTLAIAGIAVLWMVKVESEREDRESP
jgi:hypothetical protein